MATTAPSWCVITSAAATIESSSMNRKKRNRIVLAWPTEPAADTYRFLLRDATIDSIVLKTEIDEGTYALDRRDLHQNHHYEWRVQTAITASGDWVDYTPYVRLPVLAIGPEHGWLDWDGEPDAFHRVLIFDTTLQRNLIKDGVLGTRYAVDWSTLDRRHALEYSIQRFADGDWATLTDYAPLLPPAGVTSIQESPSLSAPEPDLPRPLLFLWTCDTEINMRYMRDPDPALGLEHQIFCRLGDRSYGIEFMMDMLEDFHFRGTFFLDVLLEHQFGRAAIDRTVAAILERGHDIQLHLHPSPHLLLSPDPTLARLAPGLTADDPALFREAFAIAYELFVKRVGREPVAYRSGSYHLCDAYFPVLSEFGIRIDSSLYPFKNCRTSDWMTTRTQPFWVDGVLEIPVSWEVCSGSAGWSAQQLAPAKGGRQQDAFSALSSATSGSPLTLVYLAHSFSFLSTTRTRDAQVARSWNETYRSHVPPEVFDSVRVGEESELIHLDGPVETDRIATLARLLHGVSSRPGAEGITFSDVVERGLDCWSAVRTSPVDPIPAWHAGLNRVSMTPSQIYSHGYLSSLEAATAGH
jgi:hypothetical protein